MDLYTNIPTSWADVSRKKLNRIAALYFENLTPQKLKTKALMILSDLKRVKDGKRYFDANVSQIRYEFNYKKQRVDLSLEQLRQLSTYCGFLLENIHNIDPVRFWFLKNPDKRIFKSVFHQYIAAVNEFEAYKETGHVDHLNKLCAVFYMFPCQRFNDDKLLRRARKFKLLPVEKKYMVFMWFAGVLAYIDERFEYLFGDGDSDVEMDMFSQITNMIRALNKGDVTKENKILESNTYSALAELNAMNEEAEKLKENV